MLQVLSRAPALMHLPVSDLAVMRAIISKTERGACQATTVTELAQSLRACCDVRPRYRVVICCVMGCRAVPCPGAVRACVRACVSRPGSHASNSKFRCRNCSCMQRSDHRSLHSSPESDDWMRTRTLCSVAHWRASKAVPLRIVAHSSLRDYRRSTLAWFSEWPAWGVNKKTVRNTANEGTSLPHGETKERHQTKKQSLRRLRGRSCLQLPPRSKQRRL